MDPFDEINEVIVEQDTFSPEQERACISLCMIVRDEEFCIERVLSSARPYVQEIIVVDTGSVDRTVAIAEPYADIIKYFEWINDFSAARNFSLALAGQPWILVLDADEFIAPEDYKSLSKLTCSTIHDGYLLIQRNYIDNPDSDKATWNPIGPSDKYSGGFSGYSNNQILRLFKNSHSIKYSGQIHEIVNPSIASERIGESDIVIHHYHDDPSNPTEKHFLRNLAIQEALISANRASGRDYLSAGAGHLTTTGNLEKAKEYFSKAMALGEDPGTALEALAETYYRDGKFTAALGLYQQLYDLNLGSSAVLNNLSNLLLKSGDLMGSARLLDELLGRRIEDPVRKQRIEQNLAAIRRAINEEDIHTDK